MTYRGLLRLFLPKFFGSLGLRGHVVDFWGYDERSTAVLHHVPGAAQSPISSLGYWQYWELCAYSGQIFWLAVPVILFNWKRLAEKRTAGFFLAVWVGAVWMMLGRYGFLFNLLYHVLPGASLFRGPAKMSCVATFAAAVITACFLDYLRSKETRLRLWPLLLPVAGYAALSVTLLLAGDRLMAGLDNPDRLKWACREAVYALAVTATCALGAVCMARITRRWVRGLGLCTLLLVVVADFHLCWRDFVGRSANPDQVFPKEAPLFAALRQYRKQHGPFRCGQFLAWQSVEDRRWARNLPYFHDCLEVPDGYTSYYLNSVAQFEGMTNEVPKAAIQNIGLIFESDNVEAVLRYDTEAARWKVIPLNSLPRVKFFTRARRYEARAALLAGLERGEVDWHSEAAVWDSLPEDILSGPANAPFLART